MHYVYLLEQILSKFGILNQRIPRAANSLRRLPTISPLHLDKLKSCSLPILAACMTRIGITANNKIHREGWHLPSNFHCETQHHLQCLHYIFRTIMIAACLTRIGATGNNKIHREGWHLPSKFHCETQHHL